jgi:hypothetical protein
VTAVQAERRARRGQGEADGGQGAGGAGAQAGLVGDLADQGQAVAGFGAPLGGVAPGGLLLGAVVADLAAQDLIRPPDPEPPGPGAVPYGVGGQFVYGDDQIVGPAGRQAGLGGVRGRRGPQGVQRIRVEGLVQDRGPRGARVGRDARAGVGRQAAAGVTGHGRSPG